MLPLSAVTRADETPLRVLTYNIHHGRGLDGRIDLPRIAKVIKQCNPDLVALQEVDRETQRSGNVDQLERLASMTGLRAVYGKAIDFSGGEYGVGVLSKLPVVSHKRYPLPHSEGHEQRVALRVTVRLRGGMPLQFVSTHLDHTRDASDRLAQSKQIREQFASAKEMTIVAGDLNARPDSNVIRRELQPWLPAAIKNMASTFPSDPRSKIDYVLLRKSDNWTVLATQVIDDGGASDHAPLLVTLKPVLTEPPDRGLDVASKSVWTARRRSIQDAMQRIMGPLPDNDRRCDLAIKTLEEVDAGSYVRRLVTYQSEPNSRVPAYLLIPKSAFQEPAAAVLCLHPTDNQIGHKVVVGLGGRPNRQYASELAERGYVTLAPAYPLLANYQPDLDALGYASGTMKAIWDNIRGIDLLESLPLVRKGGVGVIGHSLGGHNGVYTAVFDDRIKVVVSSCGLDRYRDYKQGDIRGWTSERYMPKLLDYAHRLRYVPFEFDELIACLAPRPCFLSAPKGDDNFGWRSVQLLATEARKIYSLHARPNALQVVHPDCGHDFPEPVRLQTYDVIASALNR